MIDRFIYINKLAHELMDRHSLLDLGWKFKFANTKTSIGWCRHSTKTIEYSKHFVMSPDEQIKDTILHEIAHALVGPYHGHDRTWKHMALRVGAKPQSCDDGTAVRHTKYNYILECPECSRQWKRFRLKLKDPQCSHCHEPLIVTDLRTGDVFYV